jgi:pimeloyl-[acyl-carrier protein] methyl ester esterase
MKTLNLKDGACLKYVDSGTGRSLVFLHGWGMQSLFFKEQVAGLSPRFRVVVPDLRGHGRSSRLRQGQGLSTLVDDVAELLVGLDLTQVIVIGWSMGAMVSWGLAQHEQSDRLSALVSIDMVPKILNDESWPFGLHAGPDASVFSGVVDRMLSDWPRFTRIFVPRIFARGRDSERKALVDWMVHETEQNHAQSMAQLWMSISDQDFRNDIANLQLPTLVTYGALSQLYRAEASEWITNNAPNASRFRFADSGHAPHLEETRLFNEAIESFARQTGTGSADEATNGTNERI